MVKTHVEESLGANPGDAALNPADSVAMGVQSAAAPPFLRSHRGRAFRALVHRPFRLLFVSFLIQQTGFWISHISLQGLMVELTHNDPFSLGQLFFALFIPAFILAPLAGVVADRWDRKRIMLSCYASVASVMALLTGITARGAAQPWMLLGLGFLLGTAFAFSGPASFAVAANAVSDEDLPSAVSLQSAANNLTRVLGPGLAAPIVATGHYELAFAFFMLASLVAAGLTARMVIAPYLPEEDGNGILRRLAAGLAHARERRPALPALLTVAALSLFGVAHVAILPVYAQHVLGDPAFFAWIVAASGVGAMIGALVTGYESQASLRSSAVRMLLYGVCLGLFAWTDHTSIALAAQVGVGYFYFAVMTSLQTLIQQVVAEEKRGRVMSLFQVAWAGLVPFGGFGMGAAADAFGVIAALAGSACVVSAAALVVIVGAPRWSRLRA
jgi:predicted MFS family arabinose efflux permease